MEIPIIVEPIPNGGGFVARFMAPDLSAQGATVEEAEQRLSELLFERLQNGSQLRALKVPIPPRGGWLPDDELTQEWLQHIRDYRAECDERDRQELEQIEKAGEASP